MNDTEKFDKLIHDLRTPLTTISGYIQMLNGKLEDPKQKRYLEQATSEIERMKQMLNKMGEEVD